MRDATARPEPSPGSHRGGQCVVSSFDRISHDHILTMLGTFPAKGMVARWLKAGVVENGRLYRTEEGTPQGSK